MKAVTKRQRHENLSEILLPSMCTLLERCLQGEGTPQRLRSGTRLSEAKFSSLYLPFISEHVNRCFRRSDLTDWARALFRSPCQRESYSAVDCMTVPVLPLHDWCVLFKSKVTESPRGSVIYSRKREGPYASGLSGT